MDLAFVIVKIKLSSTAWTDAFFETVKGVVITSGDIAGAVFSFDDAAERIIPSFCPAVNLSAEVIDGVGGVILNKETGNAFKYFDAFYRISRTGLNSGS